MNLLDQQFKFPKKLWLAVSVICFLFIFCGVSVHYKGYQPTASQSLVDGGIGKSMGAGVLWLFVSLTFGALVATVYSIIGQLFKRVK